jgi:hypothetical protein
MTQDFVDGKRKTVSAQMWKTEYELNEPSGASRAFDLDALEEAFVAYPRPLQAINKGDSENVWIWELPEPGGVYAVGADWAKEKDMTVIGVVRVDVHPKRLVKLTRINKRPYPVMIGMLNRDVEAYHAHGCHDRTGLGNVVEDYIEFNDSVEGFTMVGRARTQLLLDYVAAAEHGEYILPTNIVRDELDADGKPVILQQLEFFKRAHRATTVADVYAPGKWDSHLPDDVSMMSLLHRVATRFPAPITDDSGWVPKSGDIAGRKADEQFTAKPFTEAMHRTEGGVTIVEEDWTDPNDLFGALSAGSNMNWSPAEY